MAGTQSIMHGTLYNATNGQLAASTIPDASTAHTTNSMNHGSMNGVMPLNTMAMAGMANTCQYESNNFKTEPQLDLKLEDNKDWLAPSPGIEDKEPAQTQQQPQPQEDDNEPVIDIMINNVVCSFSVGCHLNLRNIALAGHNVEFRRENGMVTMKLRRPLTTASIWSSGKITCTGSTSEPQARIAARRIARCIQKLGYTTKFRNFRIVNVLGTCTMPFGIKITQFSQKYREAASYEPELHPGVTYKIDYPKATLKIFSTGSITVTAPSVANVQSAIEHIYPLVQEFSKERTPEEMEEFRRNKAKRAGEIIDYDSDLSVTSEEYEDF